MRRGAADIAVSVLPPPSADEFRSEVVLDERYLLAARADQPALLSSDAVGWLDYPHVVVSAEGAIRTALDDRLATEGFVRRVRLSVSSFLLVPDLLRRTDLLALVPSLLAAGGAADGLATRAPPLPVEGFAISMARQRRGDGDAALDFVAEVIRTRFREAAEAVRDLSANHS